MKFFKILMIVFLGIIVLFFAIGLLLPKTGTFERTYTINAPAGTVEYEILELYSQHLWPVWNFQDTSVVFTALDDGYKWESDKAGSGECRYGLGADMSIHDRISINGKDMAETIWRMEGSEPVELTVTFKVFAGSNVGARWTNLFLKRLIGQETDKIALAIKEKAEL